jgi:hypothetical protein
MARSIGSCYWCAEPAVSVDHVPPRGIFPKPKDAGGIDYRKNLITVPACSQHNMEASKDDEYFAAAIAATWKNNQIAGLQYSTKILRALLKSPALGTRLFGHRRPIVMRGGRTYAFQVDRDRITRLVEKIARGLYFHTFKTQFRGIVETHLPDLLWPSLSPVTGISSLRILADELLRAVRSEGENPGVFSFKIGRIQERGLAILTMVFYEGFSILCCLKEIVPPT